MDLADLAARTGLPPRRLRYVVDQRVLPNAGKPGDGRGVPRSFDPFLGFVVALAALLLDAGLRRRLVTTCLYQAAGKFGREVSVRDIPLYRAWLGKSATLEVADGAFVRVRGTGQRGVGKDVDTGWEPLTLGDAPPDPYSPMVLVRIDVTALRDMIGIAK